MALARINCFASAIVLLAAVTACGSKGSSPTSPDATLPAEPGVARVITAEVGNFKHTVTIGWDAAARATEYELFGSRTPVGSAPVGFEERTAATTFVLVEPGVYSIRVRAKNGAGTTSGLAPGLFLVLDMQDATEGLFFASGPMAEPGAPVRERVRGWPRGSTVPVNVQNDVSDSPYAAINRVAQDIQAATGSYQIPVQRTARTDLVTFNQEIYIVRPDSEEQRLFLCPHPDRRLPGCPLIYQNSDGLAFKALVAVDDTEYIAAHEFAHVWGIGHIYLPRAPSGVPFPLMGSGLSLPAVPTRLTPLELELIRTVYSNGFGPGTPIGDFIARGLIKP